MLPLITAWAKSVFNRRSSTSRRVLPREVASFVAAEVLETRTLLTVTLGQPLVNAMATTKDELVALPVTNTTLNPVAFTVQSSNPNVTATMVTGGRSLRLNVSGVDANHVAFNGDLVFRLFESEDPVTTARIIQLANSNFYNGLTFHRVISGFVAQGGDPTGTGSGGTGTQFGDEFNTDLTFTSNGLLAMANSGDDTNDSQFFVTAVDQSLAQLPQHLNFQHSIFGILSSGFDTFRKLIGTPTDSNSKPLTNEVINSATVFTDNQNGVVRLHAAAGFTGNTTLTFTADDGHGSTSQKTAPLAVIADTVNDRPFLGPVTNVATNQGAPLTFSVQGFDLEKDPLTFVVKDAASFATDNSTGANPANVAVSIQVIPASGSTPSSAVITLTPQANFSGAINLIVGVRDATQRGGTSIDSRANFDTQKITLTVNPVNHAPTTTGGTRVTPLNQALAIQLTADDGDPDKTQTLSFEIVTQPQHGSISNFNAATGALQYAPAAGFSGTDSFTYRVHDNGGTANGGSDTSTVATITINVGAATPTSLALSPASGGGPSNSDPVLLNATPVFTVSGPAGSTVTLLVNGTSQVVATETSPGKFSAKLTRQMLEVGTNSITATSTINGTTSAPTAPLTFTYSPSDATVYTVPGAFGSPQEITFQWNSRSARFRDEVGVFAVDDLAGHVNGLAPGSPGYAAAALNSASRQVIFARGQRGGATMTLNVTGGELLVFYLVSNRSTTSFLRHNPHNRLHGVHVFFGLPAANADHRNHLQTTGGTQAGQIVMHWDDRMFRRHLDFDDAVITVTPKATVSATQTNALRISGPSPNVPVQFSLEAPQNSNASNAVSPPSTAPGEIGFVVIANDSGTINGLQPGSAGYDMAALASSTRQVLFNKGDSFTTQKTLQLPAGSLIAFYYTPDSTAASVLANNPNNDPNAGPVALFSFASANPDHAEHFHWSGPGSVGVPLAVMTGQSPLLLHIFGKLSAGPNPADDFLIAIDVLQ